MRRILILLTAVAAIVSCQRAQTISVVPSPNDIQVNRGHFNAAGASMNMMLLLIRWVSTTHIGCSSHASPI